MTTSNFPTPDAPWTADQKLRSDATSSQFTQRLGWLCRNDHHNKDIHTTFEMAREFAEACIAASLPSRAQVEALRRVPFDSGDMKWDGDAGYINGHNAAIDAVLALWGDK